MGAGLQCCGRGFVGVATEWAWLRSRRGYGVGGPYRGLQLSTNGAENVHSPRGKGSNSTLQPQKRWLGVGRGGCRVKGWARGLCCSVSCVSWCSVLCSRGSTGSHASLPTNLHPDTGLPGARGRQCEGKGWEERCPRPVPICVLIPVPVPIPHPSPLLSPTSSLSPHSDGPSALCTGLSFRDGCAHRDSLRLLNGSFHPPIAPLSGSALSSPCACALSAPGHALGSGILHMRSTARRHPPRLARTAERRALPIGRAARRSASDWPERAVGGARRRGGGAKRRVRARRSRTFRRCSALPSAAIAAAMMGPRPVLVLSECPGGPPGTDGTVGGGAARGGRPPHPRRHRPPPCWLLRAGRASLRRSHGGAWGVLEGQSGDWRGLG